MVNFTFSLDVCVYACGLIDMLAKFSDDNDDPQAFAGSSERTQAAYMYAHNTVYQPYPICFINSTSAYFSIGVWIGISKQPIERYVK